MMQTYWDLSEAERGELTVEDVERYVDAELMLKGVLKVKPLVLDVEPSVPEPTTKAFVVRFGAKPYGRAEVGVAFSTAAHAKEFLRLLPMNLGSDWLDGSSVAFTTPIGDAEIAEVPIFTEEAKDAVKGELKKAAAIKAANERRRTEYAAALKAQEAALKGLWEDWTLCREKVAKLRAIADTFADYQRTAGDADVAAKFLAKVYPSELIVEANDFLHFMSPATAAAE